MSAAEDRRRPAHDPAADHCECHTCEEIRTGLARIPVGTYAPRVEHVAAADLPADLRAIVARTAALHGFEPPPLEVVHRCVCGARVRRRGATCDACREARPPERGTALARAWATIPPGWDAANLDRDLEVAPLLIAALRSWSRAKGNLLICGPTEAGKSLGTIALARRLLERAARTDASQEDVAFAAGLRWVTARDLVAAGRTHPLGAGDPPLFRTAVRASLLIVDELGFEPADQVSDLIPRLVEARYNAHGAGKRTIATTGLTLKKLADLYGAAITRKLGAGCGVVVEVF